jgi:GTP-binding protein
MTPAQAKTLLTSNPHFKFGADTPVRLPPAVFPEIAFVGRSNVGKSSLLNALTASHKLAHVSKTPGRTQQINFFLVSEKIYMVDLPGYGFAKVPPKLKQDWQNLMDSYLLNRRTLRATCLLVDSRHDPKQADITTLKWLGNLGVAVVVVATKADDLAKKDHDERLNQWQAILAKNTYAWPTAFMVSIKDNKSIDALRMHLANLI